MKYRFRVSEAPQRDLPIPRNSLIKRRRFRLKGRNAPRHSLKNTSEPIAFSHLFEIAALPEHREQAKKKRKHPDFKRRISVCLSVLRNALATFGRKITSLTQRIKERLKRPSKPKSIHALPVFAGFLCATLLITVLCAGGIFLGLFGQYHRSYVGIVIPNTVGRQADEVISEDTNGLNWIVEYENNPRVAAGTVITQSPPAGVTRRLYGRNSYCTVRLTVSQPKDAYTLENLVGTPWRDALLTLSNHQITANVTEIYSDTVPRGQVLETVPAVGTLLSSNATVTLRVSAGKQEIPVAVPNLLGMTETEAHALLQRLGLTVGSISYQSSSRAPGTIIAQDLAAYSSVSNGTALSYTVSMGDRYWLPTVPDLYGMELDTAQQTLKQHGLLGQIQTIPSTAPKGTVLMQSPAPGAPITSSTVSVEIYVSS